MVKDKYANSPKRGDKVYIFAGRSRLGEKATVTSLIHHGKVWIKFENGEEIKWNVRQLMKLEGVKTEENA